MLGGFADVFANVYANVFANAYGAQILPYDVTYFT
jgi:hypothetical protein